MLSPLRAAPPECRRVDRSSSQQGGRCCRTESREKGISLCRRYAGLDELAGVRDRAVARRRSESGLLSVASIRGAVGRYVVGRRQSGRPPEPQRHREPSRQLLAELWWKSRFLGFALLRRVWRLLPRQGPGGKRPRPCRGESLCGRLGGRSCWSARGSVGVRPAVDPAAGIGLHPPRSRAANSPRWARRGADPAELVVAAGSCTVRDRAFPVFPRAGCFLSDYNTEAEGRVRSIEEEKARWLW